MTVNDALFFDRVDVGPLDDCWKWTGAKRGYGYGGFYPRGHHGKGFYAHRWIYERATGHKIPAGLVVDHICRNQLCVNPLHLRVVTRRTNSIENSTSAAAINAAKTHCVHGHEFTEANTYIHGLTRHCRACRRAGVKRWAAKREAMA